MDKQIVEKINQLVENQNKLVEKIKTIEETNAKQMEEKKIETRINEAVAKAVKETESKVKEEPAPKEEPKPEEK
jgi:predicted transcriptional regulator